MRWLLIYRLSSGQWPDLKAVRSTYHTLTDGLPTWVEQSKDTCSWSTSSFPTSFIRAQSFLFFLCHSCSFFLCPHIIYSSSFIRCMLVTRIHTYTHTHTHAHTYTHSRTHIQQFLPNFSITQSYTPPILFINRKKNRSPQSTGSIKTRVAVKANINTGSTILSM